MNTIYHTQCVELNTNIYINKVKESLFLIGAHCRMLLTRPFKRRGRNVTSVELYKVSIIHIAAEGAEAKGEGMDLIQANIKLMSEEISALKAALAAKEAELAACREERDNYRRDKVTLKNLLAEKEKEVDLWKRIAQRRFRGCGCRFDVPDNPDTVIEPCALHADWRDKALAELREKVRRYLNNRTSTEALIALRAAVSADGLPE